MSGVTFTLGGGEKATSVLIENLNVESPGTFTRDRWVSIAGATCILLESMPLRSPRMRWMRLECGRPVQL